MKSPTSYGVVVSTPAPEPVWYARPHEFIVAQLDCQAEIVVGVVIAVPAPGTPGQPEPAPSWLQFQPFIFVTAEPRFAADAALGPSCVPTSRNPYRFAYDPNIAQPAGLVPRLTPLTTG